MTQDYLLVLPEPRKQSDVIEVVSKERYNRGRVIAAGPGKRITNKRGEETGPIRPLDVRVGDFVTYTDLDIFPKHWDGNTQYVVIQEADVCFIGYTDEQQAA
jgi:co-chaperonin GroES (HSP10)